MWSDNELMLWLSTFAPVLRKEVVAPALAFACFFLAAALGWDRLRAWRKTLAHMGLAAAAPAGARVPLGGVTQVRTLRAAATQALEEKVKAEGQAGYGCLHARLEHDWCAPWPYRRCRRRRRGSQPVSPKGAPTTRRASA
eukprot:scaffold2520_cov324-Prasinococcus_capsulatus_cf.AAC.5